MQPVVIGRPAAGFEETTGNEAQGVDQRDISDRALVLHGCVLLLHLLPTLTLSISGSRATRGLRNMLRRVVMAAQLSRYA